VLLPAKGSSLEYADSLKLASEVEVTVEVEEEGGKSSWVSIFRGEIVDIAAEYGDRNSRTCTVRAYSKLHRLLRGRNSRTFQDMTDADITKKVASEAGLEPDGANAGDAKICHEHVQQHNQTDLEFLRMRAARFGFEVGYGPSGKDASKDLLFLRKPKWDEPARHTLVLSDRNAPFMVRRFAARLASSAIVSAVQVNGWDPLKKEAIKGVANKVDTALGEPGATTVKDAFAVEAKTYAVDLPVVSLEEANAIAEGNLRAINMSYLAAEATLRGSPQLRPGVVAEVALTEQRKGRFEGKYAVVGVRHHYTDGGYSTIATLRRDAETKPGGGDGAG
jgi:phage protein D